MLAEHDDHGAQLREFARIMHDFAAPDDACPTWRALCAGAGKLSDDLMEHIHIENNVLFPRFTGQPGTHPASGEAEPRLAGRRGP